MLEVQELNIFVDVMHRGHFKLGTGTSGIVIEFMKSNGEPITREFFEGLNKTTKNRTALYSCIFALKKLNKPCKVDLFINNKYIVETFTQKWYEQWNLMDWTNRGKPITNSDLWQQLFDLMKVHNVNYNFTEINPYTGYIRTMINRVDIEYKEDKHV